MNINRAIKMQLRKTIEIISGILEEPEFYRLTEEETEALKRAQEIIEIKIKK